MRPPAVFVEGFRAAYPDPPLGQPVRCLICPTGGCPTICAETEGRLQAALDAVDERGLPREAA